MRVAIVCADFHSPYKTYFRRLARSFRRSTPVVVNWADGPECVDGIRVVRVRSRPFNGLPRSTTSRALRRLGWPLSEASREERSELETLFARERIDVALLLTGFVGDRVAEACRRAAVPFLVSFRGGDLREAMKVRGYGRRMRQVCEQAERTLGVGVYMREQLGSLGVASERIEIIPAGATAKERRPGPLPGPDGHCVFVGRLVAWKGVDLVLRATARCRDAGRDLRVSIVGDGPLRSELEALARRLGIRDAVVFHGQQSPERTDELLDETGFLVLPSLDENGGPEGCGNAAAEAMAAARPVVVSRCGGLPDHVRDGRDGYVVDQRDVAGLAEAMQRIAFDSTLRSRLGKNARDRALEVLDSDALGQRIETIALDVAGRDAVRA